MTPLTARIVEPGELYHDPRIYRLVRVPHTHIGIRCEACVWSLHIPEHHGRDRAEQLRREHLKTAHLTDLITGRVVLSETACTFSTVVEAAVERVHGVAAGPTVFPPTTPPTATPLSLSG